MDAYGNYTADLAPAPTTTAGATTSRVFSAAGVPGVDVTVPDGYPLYVNETTGDLYVLCGGVWQLV